MGIKASYFSHVTNARVWSLAGRPVIPPQQLTSNQLKQLATYLVNPPDDPIHHVVFSPGCKDRIKYTKGLRRGHPQRYWLEINLEIALTKHTLSTPPRSTGVMQWDLSICLIGIKGSKHIW